MKQKTPVLCWISIFTFLFLSASATNILAEQGVSSMALGGGPKYKNSPGEYLAYADKKAKKGGELKLVDFTSFDSFNPFLQDVNTPDGFNLVYESLTEQTMDEPFTAYGVIAKKIFLAKDRLSVTFFLNPKARFQDGSPIRAKDVRASFETITRFSPNMAQYYKDVKSVSVVDKTTIRFNFSRINPELHLILGQFPIYKAADLTSEDIAKRQLKPFIGSGPYHIKDYKMGQYIVYEKNQNHWAKDLLLNRGRYNFDRVRYVVISDSTARLEAFKAGEFDIQVFYSSREWAKFESQKIEQKKIIKTTLPHENNQGMQALIFNLRNPLFQDIRVREALNLVFDFPWTNRNIFYSQYTRSTSYYSNSELGATGLPSTEELALLNPLKAQIPATVFSEPMGVETSRFEEKKNYQRLRLRRAMKLLKEAGWKIEQGKLQKAGKAFEFLVLLRDSSYTRITEPYVNHLRKLGIQAKNRVVDFSLWVKKLLAFDFDMISLVIGQSNSPGNEQRYFFHSSQANVKNSNNYSGFSDPAVDVLVGKIIAAPNRKALVTATRALDRVLMKNYYLVPNWYIPYHRVAYWNKFGLPKNRPRYYSPNNWWFYWWYEK